MKLSTTQKVLAVVLGSAIAVAFVLTATVAPVGAAGYIFTRSLTVGSTGTDVMELQKVLNSNPATAVAATGVGSAGNESSFFGGLTKAAVAKFQSFNSITPAVGFFGDKTRAFVNNMVGTNSGNTSAGALCPNGMTLASNCSLAPNAQAPAALCPNGMTIASNCGVAPTAVSTSGTDGTLTAAQSSYVSSGIQLKKGDTKNILAVTLKASVGPVTVTRAGVHFNTRPWLLFSQVTLSDSTGKLLATVPLNGAGSATEITVGSDYLVAFPAINETVTPGQNLDLIVGASVLPATDKITNGMSIQVAFDTMRTTNGIGWTDSIGAGTLGATAGLTSGGSTNNVFTLTSTGSVADIYTRISPNSPAAHQVATSLTQTTNNVVLGAFSLKSANNSSTLNTLTVTLASTTFASGATGSSGFTGGLSNVRVYGPSGCTQANPCGGTLTQTSATVGTVVFSNMTIPLAQDTWTDLVVEADVSASTTGTGVTVALASTNIVVTDANYGTATYETNTATSNAIVFTTNAVTVSNTSLTLGPAIVQSTVTTGYNVTGAFTITNTSNNDLYISGTSTTLVTQTINGTATTTNGLTGAIVAVPASFNGDSTSPAAYIIPAGLSRSFTLSGALYSATTGVVKTLKITGILYGTAAADVSNHSLTIASGIDNMSVSASF